MRKSILLLLPALAGCGAAAAEDYVVLEDFLDHAAPVRCQPVSLGEGVAAAELRSATDSTFLVLDEARRQLLEFDHDLRRVWRLEYGRNGPGGIGAPISATLLDDTAVVVAGRAPLRLVVLSRAGEPIRSTPLDFIPHSVEATADGQVLVTPMPMGPRPPTLLLRYDGHALTGLPVPPRPFPDMMVRALGNAALVETLPNGDALVVHQFLAPRAFRVDRAGAISRVPVPTPDATRSSVDFVPAGPITEDQMRSMLVPAMALSVDPLRSEVYLMTRSGRIANARPERAVLRLDDRLTLLRAFTLDVPAAAMVFLARRGTLLVVDDMDRFHACPLPAREAADAHA